MGFREFLFRGNLIDLAVAVVIGTAFANLITAFTSGLITPLIGIFGGQPQFSQHNFTINGSAFAYGSVIDSAIAFFITALILYYLVVWPSSFILDKFRHNEELNQRICPECISKIDKNAKRCAFCTSMLEPLPEEDETETSRKRIWHIC